MKKILVTGSIAYDQLLSYDGSFADAIAASGIDKLSISFLSPHYARRHGGTGANVAWNLRLLGADPLLVGTVGRDGEEYLALLRGKKIDVSHIEILDDHVTATAVIGTDSAERQIAFFHPGADAHGTWKDLSAQRDGIAYAIVSPRNAGLMMEAVRWCRQHEIAYMFDPGQQVIALGRDELLSSIRGSKILVANAYEWELIQERTGRTPQSVLKDAEALVVTRGEHGVDLYERTGKTSIPACKPDQVVNPTGAGDGFRAGFLTGLVAGWSLQDCGRLGAAMGSFIVEQEGTLLHHLEREAVWARAAKNYGEALPPLA